MLNLEKIMSELKANSVNEIVGGKKGKTTGKTQKKTQTKTKKQTKVKTKYY